MGVDPKDTISDVIHTAFTRDQQQHQHRQRSPHRMSIQDYSMIGRGPVDVLLGVRIDLSGNGEQPLVKDHFVGRGFVKSLGSCKTNFAEKSFSVHSLIGCIESSNGYGSNQGWSRRRRGQPRNFFGSCFVLVVAKGGCQAVSVGDGIRDHPGHIGSRPVCHQRVPEFVASLYGVFVHGSRQAAHLGSPVHHVFVFVRLDPLRRGKGSKQGRLVWSFRCHAFSRTSQNRLGRLRGCRRGNVVEIVVPSRHARSSRSRSVGIPRIQHCVGGGGHPHRKFGGLPGPICGKLNVEIDPGFLCDFLGRGHDLI
mmetsp:Transcript_32741/g.77211  ORF Transcript_32741/g.77211 Transcript_32741/m.77211 type:complete len:308 (+) Transcript_32741:1196-2119(+)